MFVKLMSCDHDSKDDWCEYDLYFAKEPKGLKAGVLFPSDCDPSLKKNTEDLSGDSKKILHTDEIIVAILGVDHSKYDGVFFTNSDPGKVEAIAQIFRTHSLPHLLIVEVKGCQSNQETTEAIVHALKSGVDYVAVSEELLDELGEIKGKPKGET